MFHSPANTIVINSTKLNLQRPLDRSLIWTIAPGGMFQQPPKHRKLETRRPSDNLGDVLKTEGGIKWPSSDALGSLAGNIHCRTN